MVEFTEVAKCLPRVESFSASIFPVRLDRYLGSRCFGDIYAGGFWYNTKIQYVIKTVKKGGEHDLVLEGVFCNN